MTHGLFLGALLFLIALSAFFSGSETAVMRVNRYRMQHLAKTGDASAKRMMRLLKRPDRLLGIVLIGNTLANIMASSVVTLLAVRWYGDAGIAVGAVLLTLVVLVFAEVMPKTLAALYPERIAYPVSWVLQVLLWLFYPMVWLINGVSNGLLMCCGLSTRHRHVDPLTHEELRTLVHDAMDDQAPDRQQMLLRVLDLEKTTVNDVMIPRHAIEGIDLNVAWPEILKNIHASTHAWLPVYKESFDQVHGLLHVRKAHAALLQGDLGKERLMALVQDAYFVPEQTPLSVQLLHFRSEKKKMGVVVDEYGDVLGLITLEDILEEIVGEFAEDAVDVATLVQPDVKGGYLIEGRAPVRELNRHLGWELPTEGPKTLSGLVLEVLAHIPCGPVSLQVGDYRAEIINLKGQRVRQLRVWEH